MVGAHSKSGLTQWSVGLELGTMGTCCSFLPRSHLYICCLHPPVLSLPRFSPFHLPPPIQFLSGSSPRVLFAISLSLLSLLTPSSPYFILLFSSYQLFFTVFSLSFVIFLIFFLLSTSFMIYVVGWIDHWLVSFELQVNPHLVFSFYPLLFKAAVCNFKVTQSGQNMFCPFSLKPSSCRDRVIWDR